MRIRDWDRNLKVRLFAEAMMNITFWMFFPFLTIYFAEEFGKNKAGLLLVFSQVFSVMANFTGGYCADRFGRKRMMVLSTIVCTMLGLILARWSREITSIFSFFEKQTLKSSKNFL
ncbi:MFS transporter [Neobacillus niacini]|uniref:MFS transporter n=1 Tax=Neobacillus niacini TaxID=86668 RepID=UPI0028606AC9|nr:MFS transporter [Neobacillus niacini]MDR7002575.1 MFS family permease [Neobacillus niacini]